MEQAIQELQGNVSNQANAFMNLQTPQPQQPAPAQVEIPEELLGQLRDVTEQNQESAIRIDELQMKLANFDQLLTGMELNLRGIQARGGRQSKSASNSRSRSKNKKSRPSSHHLADNIDSKF